MFAFQHHLLRDVGSPRPVGSPPSQLGLVERVDPVEPAECLAQGNIAGDEEEPR
jgi:hypothetical protein